MQSQETAVGDVLEAPRQVDESLKNLLPAAFTLAEHLAVS